MKKIIIIGAQGQLGQYLCGALSRFDIVRLSRKELDLSSINDICQTLEGKRPDMIINASAYTAVDQAEIDADIAHLINSTAVQEIAKYAASANIPLIHYSTDYVFSGDAKTPYQEDDVTDPQGQYGLTKLSGEAAIMALDVQAYIFRTAWVYSQKGSNFYKTMLKLAETRSALNVVDDQIGSPTYAGSIAEATAKVVEKIFGPEEFSAGIFHMSCGGQVDWSGFAKKIFEFNDKEIEVKGIPSSEYPTPAKRPSYSVLSNQKLLEVFSVQLPHWEDALIACVQEQKTNDLSASA